MHRLRLLVPLTVTTLLFAGACSDTTTAPALRTATRSANNVGGPPMTERWSLGWDRFDQPLDLSHSKVMWNEPGSTSKLHVTYILVGATPNWAYQVGVHLFDRCDAAFGQFTTNIPCSTSTRQGKTRNTQAFELGVVYTDADGNGSTGVNITDIKAGNYELQFDVRAGVGCPFGPCDVIFQSPGPFGVGTAEFTIP